MNYLNIGSNWASAARAGRDRANRDNMQALREAQIEQKRILKEKGKSPAPAPENDTTQNDAPAEDGSPREPIVVDAEVVDTDDDLDLDDLPGFGRTNESKEVLRFLKIIRENDLVK